MEHLLAERVKEIMEELEYSPSGFADTIDVPRPILSHILSGRNKPSLDVIQKILMRFPELNPWWLLTGKGTMKQLSLFEEEDDIAPKRQSAQHYATSSPVAASSAKQDHKSVSSSTQEYHSSVKESNTQPAALEQKSIVDTTPIVANPSSSLQDALSQGSGKKIEKMIVFYSDKTFSVYHPE